MDGIIIKRASFYVLCFSLIGINVPPSVIAGSSSFIKFKNWFRAPTNTKPTDYVHNDDSEAKLESIKTAFKLLTSIAFYEIEIAHKKLPKLDPNDEKNVNLQSKINLFKDEILPQYYKKITHENDLAALKHSLTEFINNISALDDTIGKNIGGLQKLKKVFGFNNYGKISSAIKNFRNELHSLSESRTEEKLNNIKNETLAKCTKIMMANGLDYANQEKLMNDTLALFNIGVYNILKAYMRSCLKNNTSHNDAQNQVILNMEAYIDKKIAPPMDKLCDFIKISCGSYKNINDKVSGTTRTQDSVLKDFGNNSYMYLNMMTHINSRADVINKILIGIKSFLTQAHNGYFTKDVKHMENVKYDIPYDIRYGFNKLVSFLTLINVDRLYSYNEYEKLYRSIELIRSATVMLKSMYEFCNSYNVNMFCIDFDTIQNIRNLFDISQHNKYNRYFMDLYKIIYLEDVADTVNNTSLNNIIDAAISESLKQEYRQLLNPGRLIAELDNFKINLPICLNRIGAIYNKLSFCSGYVDVVNSSINNLAQISKNIMSIREDISRFIFDDIHELEKNMDTITFILAKHDNEGWFRKKISNRFGGNRNPFSVVKETIEKIRSMLKLLIGSYNDYKFNTLHGCLNNLEEWISSDPQKHVLRIKINPPG